MKHKLEKLSKRHDRPLRDNDGAIKTLAILELPVLVKYLLFYGPKHPVKDKYKKTYFLAAIEKLENNLRQKTVYGEKLRLKLLLNGTLRTSEKHRWSEVCQK